MGGQLAAIEHGAGPPHRQASQPGGLPVELVLDEPRTGHGHGAQALKDDVWQTGLLRDRGVDVDGVAVQ